MNADTLDGYEYQTQIQGLGEFQESQESISLMTAGKTASLRGIVL